jgi:hypothetical protein
MISPRSLWAACKYLQKVAKGLQKSAKVCKRMQKSAKGLQKVAKVCKSLQKVAKVCKNFNGKFCIPYLIKSNPTVSDPTVSNPTVFSSYHSLSRPIRSKPLPAGSRAEPSCLMWEI